MPQQTFIEKFDIFLFDCDGVLWSEGEAIEGAKPVLAALRKLGKEVIFITNNTTKTVKKIQQQIFDLLDYTADKENIITAAIATAMYIRKVKQPKDKVYLIGTPGFGEIMKEHDIECVGLGYVPPLPIPQWRDYELDKDVKFIVGSYDPHFTHTKLTHVFLYMTENNARFIASNNEMYHPVQGRVIPGTLGVLAGISACTKQPPIIVGKPERLMYDIIKKRFKIKDERRVVMIGDSYDTDILFGKNCGVKTALVYSGSTGKNDLSTKEMKNINYTFDSVKELLNDYELQDSMLSQKRATLDFNKHVKKKSRAEEMV